MTAADTPVFTGIDVVAPNGIGVDEYWAATLAGRPGIGAIERFDARGYPVRLAGEVREFDTAARVPKRLVPQTDRMTHFALAAAEGALRDSAVDLESVPEFERAVVTANSSGGFEFGQRELQNLWSRGSDHVGAYQSIAWFYAANTGQVSIRHGLKGNCGVVATEQAGGLDAAGQARRVLRHGAKVVLTGGTDASLCPWGFITQLRTGLLSTRTDPARAYLPFDADANGFVPGEGGAMLVMEPHGAAVARGAPRIYGALTGYAAGFDPPPGSDRPPALRRTAEAALRDAGLAPADVDVVFADAAGVPDLDRAEAAVLRELWGRSVPVAAPKTMTGRLYAGGAALDLATALLCLRDQVIPPATGVTAPDPGIDLVVGDARPARVRTVLILARGYGGFAAAAVLRNDRKDR